MKSQIRLSDFAFTSHFHALEKGNGNPLQRSCLEKPSSTSIYLFYFLKSWILNLLQLHRYFIFASRQKHKIPKLLLKISALLALMWDSQVLLLLLLSHFSRVRLCVTPKMAAHRAPPSLGFSRQEHRSGLPFPSPMHESEKWKWSHLVVFYSVRPHGLQPTRLLRPWDFPGKNTGVGCHFLFHSHVKMVIEYSSMNWHS